MITRVATKPGTTDSSNYSIWHYCASSLCIIIAIAIHLKQKVHHTLQRSLFEAVTRVQKQPIAIYYCGSCQGIKLQLTLKPLFTAAPTSIFFAPFLLPQHLSLSLAFVVPSRSLSSSTTNSPSLSDGRRISAEQTSLPTSKEFPAFYRKASPRCTPFRTSATNPSLISQPSPTN